MVCWADPDAIPPATDFAREFAEKIKEGQVSRMDGWR